jgi:hypothetical protein
MCFHIYIGQSKIIFACCRQDAICIQTCYYCRVEERITTFENLLPGSHISFRRCCGLYSHHAIVAEVLVEHDDPQRGKLTLIEYTNGVEGSVTGCMSSFTLRSWKCWRPKAIVQERNTEEFNLQSLSLKMYLIKYREDTHAPDVVVSRARRHLGRREYCIVGDNCEHFATFCMIGKSSSLQADDIGLAVTECAAHSIAALGFIIRILLFFLSVGKYVRILHDAIPKYTASFSAGIVLGLYFWKLFKITKKKRKGNVCKSCFRRHIVNQSIRLFITLCTLSLVVIMSALLDDLLPPWTVALVCLGVDILGLLINCCLRPCIK